MRSLLVAGIFLLVTAGPVVAAQGAGDVRTGNRFYRQGRFEDAFRYYEKAAQKNPSEARISYDLGAASYKTQDPDAAVEYFQKALLTDDDSLRQSVHYNLGNSLYQAGIIREDKDVQQAVKYLESSLESFEKARAADPDDIDAENNYVFVKKELERLKVKQQQQRSKQCPLPKKEDQPDQSAQEQQSSEDRSDDQDQPGDQKASGQDEDSEDRSGGQQEKKEAQASGGEEEKVSMSGQSEQAKISSQKEADAVVDDFERNEQPKGLLNFVPQSREPRPVEKDW